jgi:hypothetical protein
VRGAYNAAEYLAERRRMMQAYADKLDLLRSKARVRRLKVAMPRKPVALSIQTNHPDASGWTLAASQR